MLLESSPLALPLFILACLAYETILKKINFPDLFLSKDPYKRKIQAIIIIVLFWLVVLYMRSMNVKMNEGIYYYIYFPLSLVVLMRMINVIF